MGKSCKLYPETKTGEISNAYKELLKLVPSNRNLVNYLYAASLQKNIQDAMEKAGYKKNSQEEFSGKDIYDFSDAKTIISESNRMSDAEIAAQSKDKNLNIINYNSYDQAFRNAIDFNAKSKGMIAEVIRNGDHFNILVHQFQNQKELPNHLLRERVELQNNIMQEVIATFNNAGYNLKFASAFNKDINPIDISVFLGRLAGTRGVVNDMLDVKDIVTLLTLNKDRLPMVQRLIDKYGFIETAAEKAFECFNKKAAFTPGETVLLQNTITQCKAMAGIDFNSLKNKLAQMKSDALSNSEQANIDNTLGELNRKFKLSNNTLDTTLKDLDSYSAIVSQAIVTLNRQLQNLKNKKDFESEEKAEGLNDVLNELVKSLEQKKYGAGIIKFLQSAIIDIEDSSKLHIANNKQGFDRALDQAKQLRNIKKTFDAYYEIIDSVSNIDKVLTSEAMTESDMLFLKDMATKLKKQLDARKPFISELQKDTIIQVVTHFVGEKLPNGMAISEIVNMMDTDATITDYLYDICKISDPIVATVGGIFQKAWDARDSKLQEFDTRISKAHQKLRDAGIRNTEFMYDKDGRIISDYDWDAFYDAKYKYKQQLLNNPVFDANELEAELRRWEEENTEDFMGGIYRVPKDTWKLKDSPLSKLTPAQREYYDEMINIKAECDLMMPNYARKAFLPPQVRTNLTQALEQASSFKEGIKIILDRMKFWKFREDDTEISSTGRIKDANYYSARGEFDGSPLQQIPLYYINRLTDQTELTKDFSGAIQHLAKTATNYESLNEIRDIVEFMNDYVADQKVANIREGKISAETISRRSVTIIQKLIKKGGSTRSDILNGFLEMHLYGRRTKDDDKMSTRIARKLLSYNSVTKLATNLPGAISNELVGELQMIIESLGGQYYTFKDYLAAHALLTTGRFKDGLFTDMLSENTSKFENVLDKFFDPTMDNTSELGEKRYYSNPVTRFFGNFDSLALYTWGESIIHKVNMYAILNHEKVKDASGKKISLLDALTKEDVEHGNSVLKLKAGIQIPDGMTQEEYLLAIKRRIRQCNLATHGGMSAEHKGVLSRHIAGKAILNFRQWMIEHYSRRYRAEHFNAVTGEMEEGYYHTVFKLVQNMYKHWRGLELDYAAKYNDLQDYQKANVKKAVSETMIIIALTLLDFLGAFDPGAADDDDDWLYKMYCYQMKRLILDELGSYPTGIPNEGLTILNSPIPGLNTINGLSYPIVGLLNGDITKEIQRGPYKGWNKYLRNVYKYTIPFVYKIDNTIRMDESLFTIFEKQQY